MYKHWWWRWSHSLLCKIDLKNYVHEFINNIIQCLRALEVAEVLQQPVVSSYPEDEDIEILLTFIILICTIIIQVTLFNPDKYIIEKISGRVSLIHFPKFIRLKYVCSIQFLVRLRFVFRGQRNSFMEKP